MPFDILEAESELVAGFRVEYSGMKFAIIQLGGVRARARHVVPRRAAVPRRLGRARARRGSGPVWFLLKALLVFLLLTWIRWSFVRIRVDQILRVSWKLMLPATLLLLLATAVVIVLRGRRMR